MSQSAIAGVLLRLTAEASPRDHKASGECRSGTGPLTPESPGETSRLSPTRLRALRSLSPLIGPKGKTWFGATAGRCGAWSFAPTPTTRVGRKGIENAVARARTSSAVLIVKAIETAVTDASSQDLEDVAAAVMVPSENTIPAR